MCGIMGYVGPKKALPIILDGLQRLEYRGYDSAGVAVIDDGSLQLHKSAGRLQKLIDILPDDIEGHIGVGHTRWATHGVPSDANAHPHADMSNTLVVIHNGIIENYQALKEELLREDYVFLSDTDTEVIPNMLRHTYMPIPDALNIVLPRLRGAYALVILDKRKPEEIWVAREDSPLVIGIGNGENYVASDVPALLPYTRNVVFLENGERACVRADSVTFYDSQGNIISKEPQEITWSVDAAEKAGYEHFMLKEIYEQPRALRDTMNLRLAHNEGDSFFSELDDDKLPWNWADIQKIVISACGTAYYAGVAGKYLIEHLARIPVETDLASEFRYRDPILPQGTLMIVVSQSGETADTLGALRKAKEYGCPVLAISNVVGSTVAREADVVVYTQAGPEIAVASTKAYSTQVLQLFLLGLKLAEVHNRITPAEMRRWHEELITLPAGVERSLQEGQEIIRRWADELSEIQELFLIGRGLDYAVALEGSLKLKEIPYIHCEAYASGELKHGPLALISPKTPVIAMATQTALLEKTESNIQVVLARQARVMRICTGDASEQSSVGEDGEEILQLPRFSDLLMPLVAVGPLQLLSYYIALRRGNDVDKPRNLAKSVTVE